MKRESWSGSVMMRLKKKMMRMRSNCKKTSFEN